MGGFVKSDETQSELWRLAAQNRVSITGFWLPVVDPRHPPRYVKWLISDGPLFLFPVVAISQYLQAFADTWVEAIPKERQELLGFLLEEVLVDMAEDRIVCVNRKAPFVALFPTGVWSPGTGRLFFTLRRTEIWNTRPKADRASVPLPPGAVGSVPFLQELPPTVDGQESI